MTKPFPPLLLGVMVATGAANGVFIVTLDGWMQTTTASLLFLAWVLVAANAHLLGIKVGFDRTTETLADWLRERRTDDQMGSTE